MAWKLDELQRLYDRLVESVKLVAEVGETLDRFISLKFISFFFDSFNIFSFFLLNKFFFSFDFYLFI